MADNDKQITITDIDIPFGRLVMIFIKFALAAIPAAIAVSIIMGVRMMIFAGIFGGSFMRGGFMIR